MNELFLKNTQALFEKDQPLALKLRELKQCQRFELIQQSSDNLDINILDKENKDFIYNNALKELEENLKFYNDEYLRYPVLFFYGLGNGILYKALLSNPIRTHLVIFEKELEIFYLVFHYLDLSEEIRSERIIFFYTSSTNLTQLDVLMGSKNIRNFYKIYNLFSLNHFYEKFYKKDIMQINDLLIQAIKTNHTRKGNAPSDSLRGISQLTKNLPHLLTRPSIQSLIRQRKGKNENAIIVSTGPSLIKQLPLLKQIQNKASIFCADSAYAILAKHDIKPDYVLMLERDEAVSRCFNNDFGEFDRDIVFIIASLVHQKTIEYLRKNNRFFILAHRGLPFAFSLKLHEYGYLAGGMCVANMAYELAVKLNHKNIILIGQDLAYGEDGNSHPKGYVHGEDSENDRKQNLYIKAYGGKGEVETNRWWKVFKEIFEKDIVMAKLLNTTTYNATEGGARIEGSEEVPFKELCDKLLHEDKKKFKKPVINEAKIGTNFKKAAQNIRNILKTNQENMVLLEKLLEKITKAKKTLKAKLLLKQIDNFKKRLSARKNGAYELYPHILYHHELRINEILVKNPKNTEEKNKILLDLLEEYEETFKTLLHLFYVFENSLKDDSIELFLLAR